MIPFFGASGSGMAALTRDRGGLLLVRLLPKFRKRPRLVFMEREEGQDAAALQRLVRRAGLGCTPCVVLLSPADYLILTADAPAVPVQEQGSALRWQIKDRLPYPLEDAVVEPFALPEGAGMQSTPQMGAVVCHQNVVRETALLLRKAGVRLAVVDVPELAWLNLLPMLGEHPHGLALLHLEPEGGVLAMVVREGMFYLSRRLEGIGRDSELHLERIVQELQRTLDYYERRFRLPPVPALMVSGSSPGMGALLPVLADRLGLRAQLFPVKECIALECAVQESELLRHAPLLGAAMRSDTNAVA